MEFLKPAKSKLGRKYGLFPSRADHGFLKVARSSRGVFAAVSEDFTCDYRPLWRPARDQKQEGSCGAHAWAALKELNCVFWGLEQRGWKPGDPLPPDVAPLGDYLSVAHLYWLIRVAMGTFPEDSGTDNATAASVIQNVGVCPEQFLPYQADPTQAGNAQCNAAGAPYRIHEGIRVPLDEASIDAVLAARRGIVFGFHVYESFEETGSDGVVPPMGTQDGYLGDHDTCIGAKRIHSYWGKQYGIRNSWSPGWGDGGYFWVSPTYLAAVGFDAWTTA